MGRLARKEAAALNSFEGQGPRSNPLRLEKWKAGSSIHLSKCIADGDVATVTLLAMGAPAAAASRGACARAKQHPITARQITSAHWLGTAKPFSVVPHQLSD